MNNEEFLARSKEFYALVNQPLRPHEIEAARTLPMEQFTDNHRRWLMATIDALTLEKAALLATQARVEHALYGMLSGEYGWDGDDIERFMDTFRFYLIPPEPRTPEEQAEAVRRAERFLMEELEQMKARKA